MMWIAVDVLPQPCCPRSTAILFFQSISGYFLENVVSTNVSLAFAEASENESVKKIAKYEYYKHLRY